MKYTACLFLIVLSMAGCSKPKPEAAKPPEAKATPQGVPAGLPVEGKPGFITSPYAPNSGYIDVRGYTSGTEIKDPYTGKIFLVP